MEIVHKATASQAGGDPLWFVMSDDSVDRYGDVIDQKGWDLSNFRNNPVALFGHDTSFIVGHWRDVKVEGKRLLGRLELIDAVSDRLREVHAAVKAGVLRAVSVGFRALEAQPRPGGKGLIFQKSELVECSLVAVPANAGSLAVARSLNLSRETRSLIFGAPADESVKREAPAALGVSSTSMRGLKMPPLSQRIEHKQSEIVALKDQLTALSNKEDISDDDVAAMDELNSRVESEEKTLGAMKRTEQSLAVKAGGDIIVTPNVARMPVRKTLEPAQHFLRAAVVHAVAKVRQESIGDTLRRHYPDDEGTPLILRAAVAPATTTTTGWAAELVTTAVADFLETLRAVSIYPRLASLGNKITFGANAGAIRIPSRASTPSIAGSFVGEGSAIPVRRLGLQAVTLTLHKVGVISTFTREIAEMSTPGIEGYLRGEIEADTAAAIDALLLDTTAGSATRPAGLRNGVTGLTATSGGGHAAIRQDILALSAPFYAANAGARLVMLINPLQGLQLASVPGPDGTLGWANALLERFTIVESTSITAGMVVVIDANDFVSATGDNPDFRVSDQVTVHEEDTSPTAISTAGTPNVVAAPVRSMFQTDSLALRMILPMTWAMRRAGMVQFTTSVTWGTEPS